MQCSGFQPRLSKQANNIHRCMHIHRYVKFSNMSLCNYNSPWCSNLGLVAVPARGHLNIFHTHSTASASLFLNVTLYLKLFLFTSYSRFLRSLYFFFRVGSCLNATSWKFLFLYWSLFLCCFSLRALKQVLPPNKMYSEFI